MAKSAATKTASAPAGAVGKQRKKPVSSAARAGIVLPPSKARQELIKQGVKRVSEGSAVVIAGAVEYVLAELSEISSTCAKQQKKVSPSAGVRVSLADFSTSLRSYDELRRCVGAVQVKSCKALRRDDRNQLGALFAMVKSKKE